MHDLTVNVIPRRWVGKRIEHFCFEPKSDLDTEQPTSQIRYPMSGGCRVCVSMSERARGYSFKC